MFEDINAEWLKELMEIYVPEGSSIGMHGIQREGSPALVAKSIINNGLTMSKIHKGLTGTIKFVDPNNPVLSEEVLDYSYGSFDDHGNRYTVVCAIPEVITDSNNRMYYLGQYSSFEGASKNDYEAHNLPTHNLEVLPSEFILGFVVYNMQTQKNSFILNSKFISLQDDNYIGNFYTNFLKTINKNGRLYTVDNEGFMSAKSRELIELEREKVTGHSYTSEPSFHYTKSFLTRYDELKKVNNYN